MKEGPLQFMTDVALRGHCIEEGAALNPAPAPLGEGEKQVHGQGGFSLRPFHMPAKRPLVEDWPIQSPVLAFSRIWALAVLTQQTGKIREKPGNVNLPEMLKQWSKKPSFKAIK